MPRIEDLTIIPEKEYSLYINDEKAQTTALFSDDAYSARFRYATQVKKDPKQNYFGHVELPQSANYVSPFFKGFGNAMVAALPTIYRRTARKGTDAVSWAVGKYNEARGGGIDFQMRQLEKKRGVDKMTPEQKKDFYQNDPEYKTLFDKRMDFYDAQIMQESDAFEQAVQETYTELKKANERWIAQFRLEKKENDSNFAYELGSGAASLVGAIGLTAITKNPKAAAVAFGFGQTGSVYEELREKGVAPSKAIMYAAPAGVAEGTLEKVGLHMLIENMTAKTWGKAAIRSFLSESVQEGSQQTTEEVLLFPFRNDEEASEKLSRIGWSMLYGGILGSSASIVGRPFINNHAAQVKDHLVKQYGIDDIVADGLIERAVYGGGKEQATASAEIQKIIGTAELKKMGSPAEKAEIVADKMVISDENIKKMILQAANAELDPETYEGGSIEAGAQFIDEKLKEANLVSEDFDIKERVKQTALENGVKPEEAELAGTLTESFARVMTNITDETPREQWENGGELIIKDERKPDIESLSPVDEITEEEMADENDIIRFADGSYDDGAHIYAPDGRVLFQDGTNNNKNIIDLTDQFADIRTKETGEIAKLVEDYLNTLIGEAMDTATEPLQVQIIESKKGHIINNGIKLHPTQQIRKNTALINLENLIRNAQKTDRDGTVDLSHNKGKNLKRKQKSVEQYVYFETKFKVGKNSYSVEFATEQIKGQDPHLLDLYNVRVKSKGGAARSSNSSPNATDHHPYSFSLNQNRADVKQNDKIYAPDGRVLFQGLIPNKNARVDLSINTKDETADMSEEDFKNKMLETLWSFKNNKIHNVSLNSDIKIRTSSIKKYKSFFADKNKRLIVPYIPELLGNAQFNKIEKSYMPIKETNVIAYYKADVPITIDNNLMNIHLTVKEDNHGHFFWDAQFKEKSSSAGPATNPGVEEPSADFSTDSLIIEQLETDVKKNLKLNQNGGGQARGYIKMTELGNVIHLLKTADASTIVHELGHYFVNRYMSALQKVGRTEEMQGVLNWLGVQSVEEMTVEHHEKFARGFETYIWEGKAPNTHMQSLFSRFKDFLTGVYKDLVSGKILKPEEINDDVRNFFDKMLAVDEDTRIDLEKIRDKTEALKQIIQNAVNGKEVTVDGLGIEDIQSLIKAVNARLPRKPKNLTQLLRQAGGINRDFARLTDIDRIMGLQDAIGGAQGLFVKSGGIDKEDSLIDFLKANGFIFGSSESYEETSAIWENALTALENADNLYTPEGMEKLEHRQNLIEAAQIAEKMLENTDYDRVVRSVKALRKNNISAVSKDTLKYIKSRLNSIDGDYKRLIKSMLKAQKGDLSKIQSDLIDFIKNQPITGESKVKLLNTVKKAQSLSTFYKVLHEITDRAKEYYDKERCKTVQNQIQKELKGTRPKGAENQKYDYENNKLFDDLRRFNKLTKEEALSDLALRKADLTAEQLEELEETDKIRLRFLDMKSKGAAASFELLSAVLKDIQTAKELGKQARDFDERIKSLNRENARQELLEIMNRSAAQKKHLKTKIMNTYRRGFANLYSLLNSMFGKNIADKYQFETIQTDVDAHIFEETQKSLATARVIFGAKSTHDLLRIFSDMVSDKQTIYDEEGVAVEINRFHLMDIYNALKNDKTRQDYEKSYGAEMINNLVLLLTPQERAYADFLMQEVNQYYGMMNKVYIQMYATDLPKVENYWPATSEHKDQIDILGDFSAQSSIPSALKERSRRRVIPKPANAMEKFNRHIAEAEYISNLGVPYMEMKRIFKSRRVKGAIIEHFGEDVYKTLLQDMDTVSLKKKIEMIDSVSNLMNKAINNFVLAKIALAPSVFIKQLISSTNYTEQMETAKWLSGFAEGLAHPKKTWHYMMENVPFLKARLAGGNNEAMIMALAEKKTTWREALSVMTRYGDMFAIVYGGYPYLKELKESGNEQAVEKFMFATLRSQQSGTNSSLSPFQQSTGLSRVFLAFKNTPQQYMRKIVDAFIMKSNGDITPHEFNKTVLNYAIVQPILLALVSYGYYNAWASVTGEDKDDKNLLDEILTQLIINPITSIPLADDVYNAAQSLIKGDQSHGVRLLLFDDINRSLRQLTKKEKNFFDWGTIISPFVEAMTGAPMGRITHFAKKLSK